MKTYSSTKCLTATWMAQWGKEGRALMRFDFTASLFLVLKSSGESLGWEGTVVKSAQVDNGNGDVLALLEKCIGWEGTMVKSEQFDNGNGDFWPCGTCIGWECTVVNVKSALFDNGNGKFLDVWTNVLVGKAR